ncbi:MAG: DUF2752 domain-containing protein [Streptosporangiales bacterium]
MASVRFSEPHGAVAPAGSERWSRLRAIRLPLLVAAPVLALLMYDTVVSPFEPGHFPPCPFLATFGVYDPGDGGLRAVHALMHGHPLRALDLNAYGIALSAMLAMLWGYWLYVRAAGLEFGRWASRVVRIALVTAVVVAPVFAVVRNLPFGQVLAP